jgi:hypothetical protein
MLKFVRTVLQNMFGMDCRSLALLRIGLALCILGDLGVCGSALRAFYTDDGLFTRSMAMNSAPYPVPWDFHLGNGGELFEWAMFAFQGLLAALLLVGWRTRLMTVASWVMLCSLQARNPLILFGADMMLRLGLFWAMFMPLGRRYSLDAAAGRVRRATDGEVWLGAAGVAYIVQFMLIYIGNSMMKTGPSWLVDHTAVGETLGLDVYGRPFGQWLGQFDSLTSLLTMMTIAIEYYGPFLFIFPFWSGWWRGLGFVVFLILQIAFGVTLQLGLFGWVMVGLMLALLPSGFWTRLAEPLARRMAGRLVKFAPELRRRKSPPAPTPVVRPTPARGKLWRTLVFGAKLARDGALLYILAVVLNLNYGLVPGKQRIPFLSSQWIIDDFGLDQHFDMFAPDPQTDDGWYVIRGTLKDGDTADLFSGASPATFDRPADVADSYQGERWMAYLIYIWYPDDPDTTYRFLAQYLAAEWNRSHPKDRQVKTVEIYFVSEPILSPHTHRDPEPQLYWTENLN